MNLMFIKENKKSQFGFKTDSFTSDYEWDEILFRSTQTLFGEKSVETSMNFFDE